MTAPPGRRVLIRGVDTTYQFMLETAMYGDVFVRDLPGPRKRLRVGFDLDGVMYPLVPALQQFMVEHRGRTPESCPLLPPLYDFGESWGLSREEFVAAMHAAVDAGVLFTWGDPINDAAAAIDAIRADGHEVHIVTHRYLGAPGAALAATRRWLGRHGIAYDSLTIAEDKTAVPTDLYVDDLAKNYDAVEAAGTIGVLMDASYNQDPSCTRRRIRSLLEYVDVVRAVAAGGMLAAEPRAADVAGHHI